MRVEWLYEARCEFRELLAYYQAAAGAEAARELLLAGHYATSVPCALPGEESIAKVELVYRAGTYEQVWLPYYRFLAELPKELGPADPALKDYGAYYVPAVEGKYIANMPTYDGGFNK